VLHKMLKPILLVLLFIAVPGNFAEKARFDSYQVHRIIPSTNQQVRVLRDLENNVLDFSFWISASKPGRPVDILVPPHTRPMFHEFLTQYNLESRIYIENLQSIIDEQESKRANRPRQVEWTDYHTLDEIYDWLGELERNNPSIVKVVQGGTTYEKRNITGITITFNANNPGVYFESGIHAREWIGPAASTWIVNEILNSTASSIWRRFNYLYFPSVNPDGYVYTWTNNRLWRKTRKPYGSCVGADPNRNWDIHWGEIGSSTNPCSESYMGSKVFSEIESKSLSDYLLNVGKNYDIFVAFHSYSQLLMFPWGYTSRPIATADLHQRIGDLGARDLQAVNGLKFKVGNIYDTIYPTSGTTVEWYYAVFNNTLAYTFETRDTGDFGFVLPPEQILPGAKELQAAVQRFLIEYEDLKRK